MSQSSKAHSAVQSFLHSDFYGPPVQLELVEDNHFLGFDVVSGSRQFKYILPEFWNDGKFGTRPALVH